MQRCSRVKKARERKKHSTSTLAQTPVLKAVQKVMEEAIEKEKVELLQSKVVVPPPLLNCACELDQNCEGLRQFNRENADILMLLLALMFPSPFQPLTLIEFFQCYLEVSIQEQIEDKAFVQSVFDKWRSAGGHTCQVSQLLEKAMDWERREFRGEEEENLKTLQRRITLPLVGACNCSSSRGSDFFRHLQDQFDSEFEMFGQVVSGYAGASLSVEEVKRLYTEWKAGGDHLCQIKAMLDSRGSVLPPAPQVRRNVTKKAAATSTQSNLAANEQEETVETLKEKLEIDEAQTQLANMKKEAVAVKKKLEEKETAEERRAQRQKDSRRVFETSAENEIAEWDDFRGHRGEEQEDEELERFGYNRDVEIGQWRERKSRCEIDCFYCDYNCSMCVCFVLIILSFIVIFLLYLY